MGVQRLIKITSILLLAIWLPATLHCNLEAAGLIETHCAGGTADDDCKTDLCANIESALIKESAPVFNLAAPVAHNHLPGLVSFLTVACERETAPSLSVVSHPPPLEITAGWQFIIRAAPPSRAPSLNA